MNESTIPLFDKILRETKVNAIRHHSKEEAAAVVDAIKDSIKKYKFDILDRDKNLDFMHEEHVNKEMSKIIIDKFLEPRNLVAVLQNRNDPTSELYLFSMAVPVGPGRVKYIYLKVDISSDGRVKAISWHKQNEKMQVDYRGATDNSDSSYLKRMGRTWMRLFNNVSDTKILEAYPEGDEITFIFERPVNDDDNDIVQNLARSIPKDFGYKARDVFNNISFRNGDIKVHLKFGHF